MKENFVRGIVTSEMRTASYPYTIPAVAQMDKLVFDSPVTFLVGENGSGKSTIIESIAMCAGFNGEGGTKHATFSTYDSSSDLYKAIRLSRGSRRESDGYFLRAESFYNVLTDLERSDPDDPIRYGGKNMHEQSHGESFMWLINHRFRVNGLYILDEPESALSPQRQLALLVAIQNLVENGSQFIIATHSPILLSYPGATIYQLDDDGVERVDYDEIEHVQVTKDFLDNPAQYLRRLFQK